MVAAWMLYALFVSCLLTVAALALERGLRLYGVAGRWVWAAALGGSIAVPAAAWLAPAGTVPTPVGDAPGAGVFTLPALGVGPALEAAGPLNGLGAVLGPIWVAASAGFMAWLLLSGAVLAARRRGWREAEVDGRRVLVSPATGPAVVGWFRSRVVVPEWVLELDDVARSLLLAHEAEHERAGDQRLTLAGLLAVALVPWNPVAWWQWRRLRLAVEIDCDARVLRGHPDVRRYGDLLVDVGRRMARPGAALAAFAEPRSFIYRRIRTMTESTPSWRTSRAIAAGTVAVVALAFACESSPPERVAAADEAAEAVDLAEATVIETDPSDGPHWTPYDAPPRLTNASEVMAALTSHYPPVLREAGIGGTVLMWFFIDETGTVKRHQIHTSSGHQALDEAALRTAATYRFSPAMNRGAPVGVWVAQPITFQAPESAVSVGTER